MAMKNPPHPGEIIRALCIEPLDLTITKAAEGLGITRKTLSLLLNGHAGISPEMAIRLSQAFGRSPESWLHLQAAYDLAQVRKSAKPIRVKPFAEPTSSPA
jgi:addiction module HigA family antidote